MGVQIAADWSESPDEALAFYLSLTFAQQTALAYVIDWQRRETKRQAISLVEQLRAEYAAARSSPAAPGATAWRDGLQDTTALGHHCPDSVTGHV